MVNTYDKIVSAITGIVSLFNVIDSFMRVLVVMCLDRQGKYSVKSRYV